MTKARTDSHFHDAEVLEDLYDSKPRKLGFPVKSPSVPNFHGVLKSNNYNSSVPLFNASAVDRLQADPGYSQGGSSANSLNGDDDANLSVIDMYGGDFDSPRKEQTMKKMDTLASGKGTDHNTDRISSNTVASTIETPIRKNVGSFDRYGFRKQTTYISEGEYDIWWTEYSQYCVRRKGKWELLLEKSGLSYAGDSPTRFPARSEKLKRYVRKGIPAEWRGNAWWYFAKGDEILNKNKGLYDKLLSRIDQIKVQKNREKLYPDLEIIERDLHRTFPDNIHFQRESFQDGESTMIKSLRRVLVAFSLFNPKIGYCQSMNFLSGLLLLFLDEEKAFWMLVIITSRYLPGVHNVNLEGVNVDQGVLMLCVKEYLPEIWSYIKPFYKTQNSNRVTMVSFSSNSSMHSKGTTKNEFLYKLPPVTLCTASWFMSCFVGVTPIETTLRIWDCMFYEESNFLFKASLGILKMSEQTLNKGKLHSTSLNHHNQLRSRKVSQDESDMELFQALQTFPKKLLNPNDLFEKIIFKRRITFNNLDQEEIDRCRKFVKNQRNKYKNYIEAVDSSQYSNGRASKYDDTGHNNGNNTNTFNTSTPISDTMIQDVLSSEGYGFKKGISGVNWNNSIKERVRQIRKRKDKE
ncbi:hypothetical protein KAFR_0A08320 [Kazachstania africana CBS 2517]|uniref:Rab-GAP TBC domain-containing protein n=1 Tax=Kazachstania africana (strain ATCC 22294 / BCRC 22015 / CBS 2517 / CECT 1963 / NBRC 1671 / NRRL Y-8276) TaxID=1071382 RepID=H2APG6_KAZAF|nr:hypothetical protein KAFR_0A08320 [Kazachstania africana CBS 2517]CCF56266.1 hypothetical protein KAFR_0A08320 [Kazachstania africana CBS 2517]